MTNNYYWQTFVIVSALSFALTWRGAPHLAQLLPPPVRQAIRSAVVAVCPDAVPGATAASSIQEAAPDGEATPAVAPLVAAATATNCPPSSPAAPTADSKTDRTQTRSPSSAGGNPTSSPYLKPAADAYREFKKLSAELERLGNKPDMAEQRRLMKKLHYAQERVEFLNRKHREWKQAHPQPQR